MNRKKIGEIPHGEAEQTGKWMRAFLVEDTLVIDCYEARNYIGRYCMQRDGRYDFLQKNENKWKKRKFCVVYKNPWYWAVDIDCSSESHKVIQEYTGERAGSAARLIDRKESGYNCKKSEKAFMRKTDRINALMDEIPLLPDGFYTWLNQTIFADQEYMFKTEPGGWKCTACGKGHTSKTPYKNNQIVRCSRTGKEVTVKSRNMPIKKQENVMIFQEMDESKGAARHFVAERIWSSSGCATKAYENVRYILGKNYLGNLIGFEKGRNQSDVVWYYGQLNRADELEQEWWDTNKCNKRCNAEYCYPEGVKEALMGTAYDHALFSLHLETFANLGWKMQYNKMMINKNLCGFMEYLAKSGLQRLTQETSSYLSSWTGFYDGEQLNIGGKNASEVLGIDMQRFHRMRQQNGGYRYLKWMKWEQSQGRKLPEETVQWMDRYGIDCEKLKFIADRMTPVQIANYLERQSKQCGKSPHRLLEYWKDYLSMAERLEMDIMDEIVYRTKNLILRHDELAEVINSMNEDEQANIMRKEYPNVETILGEIKERYEYETEKYLLVVPRKIQDIMRDGRQLHHCAASSKTYFDRISKRETYIMFIRKKSRPLYAWYTLEVEPGGTVRQKRSEFNRQPEIEEVVKFIKEWQRELKSRLKREDKKFAEESKKSRIMELEKLKKENSRFAGVLEADLMEVM